ncbi:MAG: hypothetical protein M3R27_03900 [Bacteroidota bacterium]|nr:hypothetical protein [Bacteroidota bacterium]
MKKITLISCVAIALAFASCKKETPVPQNNVSERTFLENQISEIIGKADADLYDRIYNVPAGSKAAEPSFLVTHGIFHVPPVGGPESGTCLPHETCICHITLVWPKLIDRNTPTEIITENLQLQFNNPGEAEVVMNAERPYSLQNIRSVSLNFTSQSSSIVCSQFQ